MQVVQEGYLLHDRLLRPAMVGVAKAPAGGEAGAAPETEEAGGGAGDAGEA